MDQLIILILVLVVIAAILSVIALPIIALVISVRTKKKLTERISMLEAAQSPPLAGALQQLPISGEAPLATAIQQLKAPIEKLEAALTAHSIPIPEVVDERVKPVTEQTAERPATEPVPHVETTPAAQPPESLVPEFPSIGPGEPRPPVTPVASSLRPVRTIHAEQIESIIGRRWLGWAAVGLIVFAAAFFLKYAFDNRWIGELGRVAIGVAAGVSMTVFGFKYYKRSWRIFSQILTAGGVILLYLSVYAAFGYYHLATQKAAFAYLAILVAEAAGLALLYDAPATAIMALVGGFLAPILLRSDRAQYRSLFGYIAALDVGALALLKHWRGLSWLAFGGTHLLFWLWYDGNYHPRKLGAVNGLSNHRVFDLSSRSPGQTTGQAPVCHNRRPRAVTDQPFVFFATAYHLLNANHHDWMGVFAIGMALFYAGAAKILLGRSATTRSESLSMIGVALTFVTIAIPIQLRSNWITIAWSMEALIMLWAGIETRTRRLRALAYTLFALALVRLVFWDTPSDPRPMFTPVLNKYFLSSLVVTACLFGAAVVYQRLGHRKESQEQPGSLPHYDFTQKLYLNES